MTEANDPFGLTRRGLLPAFALYAFAGEARAAKLVRRTGPGRWIDRQSEIARSLARGEITPLAWTREVERLAGEIDPAELMAAVRGARITVGDRFGNDPQKRTVRFVDATGAPRRLGYGAALFAFEPHNVITPHGHRHMVSAHLVVEGRLRVRNFDRLRDAPGAMIVRPTKDYVARVGEVSTMCGQRDNIHWFVPVGGRAATFDVVVSGLDAGRPDYEITAIDPLGGRQLVDGAVVAPVMDFGASSKKYTARH
jgi:hypothetical protein